MHRGRGGSRLIPFRISAAPVLLTAVAAPVLLARSGLSPRWVMTTLVNLGEMWLALWVVWFLLAPVLLLAAALGIRRTPWPWVALVSLHLVSLLVATMRLGHWAPGWAWTTLAVATVAGVASVVLAVDEASGTG
ncbi:hypothetical protein [Nocardioides sp. AE5]|uniref:hypothetical protein n=1 Tax=Nocardioides sp. AE5 TaxID=2962573 RepID=UPI002881247E|nr:hypothetical protein [Nocardioides sp. AE5]MDT0201581.1 hypothetical protein [Nocardioides sp. AE5]